LKGCIKFNQPAAQLQLPDSWADRTLDSADETLAPMLAERCQMMLTQLNQGDDWVQKVQSFLLTSDSANKRLSETAVALGVSTAKLRWQLAKSKTNYKQILLDVRMKLACQFLKDTPLTLQQISYQLGYAYPSNFQLAFKKYFESSPGEWRSLHVGDRH
jgi:AraC-like DNA-binding protein